MDDVLVKLSPSSATDFKSCAQLFKFRSIDRLPEPVSPSGARGSIVHKVLERLFLDEPHIRTPERALDLLHELWEEARAEDDCVPDDLGRDEEHDLLAQAHRLLTNYFRLEDPRLVSASKLEWWVEYELPEIQLRGIIDRLEERPDGTWVLTDYKTGKVPGASRELSAFFGLHFYALVCWRAFGVIPREIRLVYLADPAVLTLTPNERMLEVFERKMRAMGRAIRRGLDTGDWRPRPSPFCMSCSFQTMCPAWTTDAP
jgi:putative RecB family exonuclease